MRCRRASNCLPRLSSLARTLFLVLMVAYIWSIGRRLNKVEKEMVALQRSGSTRSGAS